MAHKPPDVSSKFILGAVTTRLTVTVPTGLSGGELVRVAAPDGSYHTVMVPDGLSAGQQFSVELLASPADGSAMELAKVKMAKHAWLTATLLTPVTFACHG
eukprot:5537950-Pleurochrysis_carterae.AAC.1